MNTRRVARLPSETEGQFDDGVEQFSDPRELYEDCDDVATTENEDDFMQSD